MFRWLLGGREPQAGAEKTTVLNIGEEQIQNPYTELTALKGHHDIVRFLVQVDDNRFASACDDGSVLVWDLQTGEVLFELHGHNQKITAIAVFPTSETYYVKANLILTASSDKTAWDCESGQQWRKTSDFHSTVKTLIVVQSLDVWLSGGSELRVWNRNFNLLGETGFFSDGELTFVSGCDAGELIVWDALDWSIQGCERNFPHIYAQQDSPPENRLLPTQEEVSIQHLSSDRECVYVAVGRGIYVYNLHTKRVIAFQKNAHDSSIQHMANIPNRQLVSCSEDGSVRIWELRSKPQLQAESVPAVHILLLQMFLYFQDHGLVTCSADQLIILWKEGKRESRLRSLLLFQKLEQNGDLLIRYSPH
ncbi:hypothetical protein AB205_0171610 [Aquarana catesbeiana]|uniref:WD repeat-containing protein 41 n=1 Tax=Aquarana catesbeiana TaxID=8400 RepID=A0A2G9RHK3_AQUCT|nr:hypothetical protein AB205_0171610 [Aquarana catesbeiana]